MVRSSDAVKKSDGQRPILHRHDFLRVLAIVFFAGICALHAQDLGGPLYKEQGSNQVKLKSTDTVEGRVPHVIVDAGGGGGGSGTEYIEDSAAVTNPQGPMTMGVRKDTLSTSEVSADGDNVAIKATSKGQLHVFIADAQPGARVNSTAYEASRVLKASAGKLISLIGYNSRTSAQFIQLFDSTTVPSDATAPIAVFTVPASSNFSLDIPMTGLPCATGIAVSNSSTGPTKTIGSADVFFTAVVQ